jgi:hypothetical protein
VLATRSNVNVYRHLKQTISAETPSEGASLNSTPMGDYPASTNPVFNPSKFAPFSTAAANIAP